MIRRLSFGGGLLRYLLKPYPPLAHGFISDFFRILYPSVVSTRRYWKIGFWKSSEVHRGIVDGWQSERASKQITGVWPALHDAAMQGLVVKRDGACIFCIQLRMSG